MVGYDGDPYIPKRAKGAMPSSSDFRYECKGPTAEQLEAQRKAREKHTEDRRLAKEQSALALMRDASYECHIAEVAFANARWFRPVKMAFAWWLLRMCKSRMTQRVNECERLAAKRGHNE